MFDKLKDRIKSKAPEPRPFIDDPLPDPGNWMTKRRGTFVIYKAKDGYRWRLVSSNGKITAESGESYIRHFDCRKAALRVADVARSAKVEGDKS